MATLRNPVLKSQKPKQTNKNPKNLTDRKSKLLQHHFSPRHTPVQNLSSLTDCCSILNRPWRRHFKCRIPLKYPDADWFLKHSQGVWELSTYTAGVEWEADFNTESRHSVHLVYGQWGHEVTLTGESHMACTPVEAWRKCWKEIQHPQRMRYSWLPGSRPVRSERSCGATPSMDDPRPAPSSSPENQAVLYTLHYMTCMDAAALCLTHETDKPITNKFSIYHGFP